MPLILKIGDPQQTSVFGVETHNVVGTLDKLNEVGTDWVRRNGLLWSEVEKLGAFGDFMYATVQKYSQPPYNVKYWEMWNEPDAATSFFRKDPHAHMGVGAMKPQPIMGEVITLTCYKRYTLALNKPPLMHKSSLAGCSWTARKAILTVCQPSFLRVS